MQETAQDDGQGLRGFLLGIRGFESVGQFEVRNFAGA